MTTETQTPLLLAIQPQLADAPERFTVVPYVEGYWVFDYTRPALGPMGHREVMTERDRLRAEFA